MGFFNKLFGKNKKENENLLKEEKFEEKNKINSETENMEKIDISCVILVFMLVFFGKTAFIDTVIRTLPNQ